MADGKGTERADLERCVAERTQELEAAVVRLRTEVEKRVLGEDTLRDLMAFQATLAAIRGLADGAPETELWSVFLEQLCTHYRLRLAWFGKFEDGRVRPLCAAGAARPYLDGLVLEIRKTEEPDAQCAMSRALLDRRPFGYANLAQDPGFARWRQGALDAGLASSLALPVEVGERIAGGVLLYGAFPGSFGEARVGQLHMLVREVGELLHEHQRRRDAESMLIRAERLAAVGTLASGVAHEFNNINTAVLGFAELALRHPEPGGMTTDCLQRIVQAAKRASSITRNLLAFAGAQRFEAIAARLHHVAVETLAMVARDLETHGIRIENRLQPLPETAMDPAQIGQILLNLLINASHALLDRPDPRITLTCGEEPGWVWLRVSDNGCGIPPDRLQQIFSPFYSTKGEHAESGSPQSRVRGTGLGLSVCQAIAARHGGELRVESVSGAGSDFTLRLPRRAGATTASAPERTDPEIFRGARVLVLDDEEDTRVLVARCLAPRGATVIVESDGAAALERLRGEGADLLILDLQMPRMDGAEFLRRLSAAPPARPPARLVITGRETRAAHEALAGLAIEALLTKPFSIDDFEARAAALLTARRRGKPEA